MENRKYKDYFSKKQLKNNGWTDELIDKYLKSPDLIVFNQSSNSYYLIERVDKITKENKELKKIKDKRDSLVDFVNSIDVKIESISEKELLGRAIAYQISVYNIKDREFFIKSLDEDNDKKINCMKYYARYVLTSYPSTDYIKSHIEKEDFTKVMYLLSNRIEEIILDKYPYLKLSEEFRYPI